MASIRNESISFDLLAACRLAADVNRVFLDRRQPLWSPVERMFSDPIWVREGKVMTTREFLEAEHETYT